MTEHAVMTVARMTLRDDNLRLMTLRDDYSLMMRVSMERRMSLKRIFSSLVNAS